MYILFLGKVPKNPEEGAKNEAAFGHKYLLPSFFSSPDYTPFIFSLPVYTPPFFPSPKEGINESLDNLRQGSAKYTIFFIPSFPSLLLF